jgi:AAA+ ATPase superfamily predicted ATPase
MRAKTTTHVEYEICKAILNSEELGLVIEEVKAEMVPEGDSIAEKRFNNGTQSLSQLLQNIVDRRLHRIPKNHQDYTIKGD